jgi:hypothetical protein
MLEKYGVESCPRCGSNMTQKIPGLDTLLKEACAPIPVKDVVRMKAVSLCACGYTKDWEMDTEDDSEKSEG